MIRVAQVEDDKALREAFRIREEVFIGEQDCPPEEEFDGFDEEAVHFIAYFSDEPAGTSRYRITGKGVKLERFAVLQKFRGKGVGKKLMEACLSKVAATFQPGTLLYLHAQLNAMPLYVRYDFQKVGNKFVEAGIEHLEMHRIL